MEPGDQSSGTKKRKNNTQGVSALTMKTIDKIKKYPRHLHPATKCTLHDMASTGYGWLLPGWVAEERRVQSGRVYRYYYDPQGHFYKTQQEVIDAWDKCGLVVIDK